MPNGDPSGLGQATAAAPAACGNNDVGGGAAGCGAALAPPVDADREIAGIGDEPPEPVLTPVGPVINVAKPYVLVHKDYLPGDKAVRVKVHLTTDAAFDGTGTLTITTPDDSNAGLAFYRSEHGDDFWFDSWTQDFPGDDLTIGIDLWAQGTAPSSKLGDITLELSLAGGSKPIKPPVQGTLTAVEVTLDLCMSRATLGVDPVPLSDGDKINAGRFVHVQKAQHHGRALLIVRKAQPPDFPGTLVLLRDNAKVRVFNDEIPAAGQVPIALPQNLPNGGIPADGQKYWVEGVTASSALRDTGFKLGVQGLTKQDGDWTKVTVVELRNMSVSPPSTPPNTPRGAIGADPANGPVPRHLLKGGFAPKHYSDDFTENRPAVMLRNSTGDMHLSVEVKPAGVPVAWAPIERARKPGTPDFQDHADIVALTAGSPGITPDGGNPLRASMDTDSVGSFHIRAFIDCNGNNTWEGDDSGTGQRIDREPFIVMNLVVVQATLQTDDSITYSNNFVGNAAGGGINVSGGLFNIAHPERASIHMNATIEVVGGGADGKLGLNRVFAGWVNNEAEAEDIVGTFRDAGPPVAIHRHRSVFARNFAAATGAHPAGSPAFLPGDPAPVHVGAPLLDTGRLTPGTGGDTATLSRSRIRRKNDLAPDPGQRWIVESVDSPGDGEPAHHLGIPAAVLTHFRFGLHFRASLCIWTSLAGGSGATNILADRLYNVVLTYLWTTSGEWAINPGTGAVAHVGVPQVDISDQNTTSPSVPVEGTGIEVRFPTGLALLARDCRA